MAILEKEILVTVHNKTIYHFENLGYDIPKYKDKKHNMKERVKRGTKILVKIEDLPIRSNVKLTKICDNCGKYLKNKSYSEIMRCREMGDGNDYCKKCQGIKSSTTKKENVRYEKSLEYYAINNDKEYLIEELSNLNFKLPKEISYGSADSYLWKCSKCKSLYDAKVNSRTSNDTGCPYCAGFKVNETNSLSSVNPIIAKEWNENLNKDISPDMVYIKSRDKYWWNCNNGHSPFLQSVRDRHEHNCGCPVCNESKGEKRIRKWLESNNFEFKAQNKFDGLIGIGGGQLSYDFYLPNYSLLIEYQGEFHDGKVNDYVRENLEYRIEHDNRKREYAELNNIELLEIWYWDFENIESILIDKLGGIKWQLN